MKIKLSEEATIEIEQMLNAISLWSNNIYDYCVNDEKYEKAKNKVTETNDKRLLHDTDVLLMALIVLYHYQVRGNFISRRQLSRVLDSENPKARDTKIVRHLEKLERFGLFIHNEPSEVAGDRGARFIEPTTKLINFFNEYCEVK